MSVALRTAARILLGAFLIAAGVAHLVIPAPFVAVFPGNVSQYVTGTDAFGLDTDGARAVRLLFQPLLVAWAVWAGGSWSLLRRPGARR